MINWIHYVEGYDTKHLQRDINMKHRTHCQEASNSISKSFIKLLGVDKSTQALVKQKISIELLQIEMAFSGNKSLSVLIELKEAELTRVAKGEEKVNYASVWNAIEKFFGFRLDKDISVLEFFQKLQYINSEVDRERKQIEQWQKAKK